MQNHRGFGFVVFQDPNTVQSSALQWLLWVSQVDALLRTETSRFLDLKDRGLQASGLRQELTAWEDGKRIEVKRAKTSQSLLKRVSL